MRLRRRDGRNAVAGRCEVNQPINEAGAFRRPDACRRIPCVARGESADYDIVAVDVGLDDRIVTSRDVIERRAIVRLRLTDLVERRIQVTEPAAIDLVADRGDWRRCRVPDWRRDCTPVAPGSTSPRAARCRRRRKPADRLPATTLRAPTTHRRRSSAQRLGRPMMQKRDRLARRGHLRQERRGVRQAVIRRERVDVAGEALRDPALVAPGFRASARACRMTRPSVALAANERQATATPAHRFSQPAVAIEWRRGQHPPQRCRRGLQALSRAPSAQ